MFLDLQLLLFAVSNKTLAEDLLGNFSSRLTGVFCLPGREGVAAAVSLGTGGGGADTLRRQLERKIS